MKAHEDFNSSTFKEVALDLIDIPEYQREQLERWVVDMEAHWDAHLFRPVTLSLRDNGRYAVIDGQHTIAAVVRRGHKTVPSIVYIGLSLAEEAALFSDLNTQRRKPEAFDVWYADLIAKRDWAVTLQDLAERHGLVIAKGGTAPSNLRAVGALRELIKKGHSGLIDEALDILTSVYDPADPNNQGRVERPMVLGMVDLINRSQNFDAYDKDLFKRKLRRASYWAIGQSQKLTPKGFQSYLNSLIASGDLVIPALNSGMGQALIYGKAFALAILGKEQARKVYGS